MTNDETNPNDEWEMAWRKFFLFWLRHSFVIGHSGFVIFDNAA